MVQSPRMADKQCFKCGETKDLSEFYVHKKMADGHLNKCKSCTKKDTEERQAALSLDPEWILKDRARHRDKSRKYREEGRAKPLPLGRKVDPVHKAANTILGNAIKNGTITRQPCIVCGNEKSQGHHEDYNKPLDVHWLCTRHHNDRHIHIRDCETLGKLPLSVEKQFTLIA